jgi:glucose/arabinose dehydrogenase
MGARRSAYAGVLALAVGLSSSPLASAAESGEIGTMAVKTIATGLKQAWSIDFLPDGTGIFTQKDAKTVSTITKSPKSVTSPVSR